MMKKLYLFVSIMIIVVLLVVGNVSYANTDLEIIPFEEYRQALISEYAKYDIEYDTWLDDENLVITKEKLLADLNIARNSGEKYQERRKKGDEIYKKFLEEKENMLRNRESFQFVPKTLSAIKHVYNINAAPGYAAITFTVETEYKQNSGEYAYITSYEHFLSGGVNIVSVDPTNEDAYITNSGYAVKYIMRGKYLFQWSALGQTQSVGFIETIEHTFS